MKKNLFVSGFERTYSGVRIVSSHYTLNTAYFIYVGNYFFASGVLVCSTGLPIFIYLFINTAA